jgi:hypothetical protein
MMLLGMPAQCLLVGVRRDKAALSGWVQAPIRHPLQLNDPARKLSGTKPVRHEDIRDKRPSAASPFTRARPAILRRDSCRRRRRDRDPVRHPCRAGRL